MAAIGINAQIMVNNIKDGKNISGTVVYVGGFEMPDGNAAAHRVLNNGKIFLALGYRVVFCGVDKTIDKDTYPAKPMCEFFNCPQKYPNTKKDWFKGLFDFSHIKRVMDGYDDVKYVVAYNMHAVPLKKLISYCKKKKIMIIADITEWYENKFSLSPVKFIKWLDCEIVMKRLHKKVDGIIAISKYLYDHYKKTSKSIIQLPPLVDVSENIWQNTPESRSDKVEFIYSGIPSAAKDRVDVILDCFSDLKDKKDFLFTIVGKTRDEFIKAFPKSSNIIDELGEKAVFTGRLSHKESVSALLRADYCVFIRERTRKNTAGFPTKFAECVTSGIGVIVNDISNISDYFPIKNGTLLPDAEKKNVESAIDSAIDSGKVDHVVSDMFDYKRYIDKMDEFLKLC